ncbi:MAG: ATP-binding cassette domain-containing protein [Bacteroidota bacterium]
MSERILKALMQLFAIIGADEGNPGGKIGGEKVIESMLGQQLSKNLVNDYVGFYKEFQTQLFTNKKTGQVKRKRTSVNSVKVLRICDAINKELTSQEKVIVMVKLLEFINSNKFITEQENEFVTTVADTFNLDPEESSELYNFVINDQQLDSENLLYINGHQPFSKSTKYLKNTDIKSGIKILRIESINWYFLKVNRDENLQMNGISLKPNNIYSLNNGASIRNSKVNPIYYSDVISLYLDDKSKEKISFVAKDISYKFKKGNLGLRDVNINEGSGKLVGIMGGSGSGKSTLLNVLNGNYKPSSGKVTMNGIDIHSKNPEIEGQIGYVAQDDLLIEELTVYQNLFFNAQLCFSKLSNEEIAEKVDKLLISLGLIQTKALKVGNPLEKTISGGQRKRLNIALELIREPAVLFVDEPTSGLSSRDSENIMDLLKELTLKGKLIFVVIHQPSSDIFKMFDKLVLLDMGGYPIYYGDPLDSILYFKEKANQANFGQSQCITCGNVESEQVFNIVESRVVDEYGNLTEQRKVNPQEWNEYYTESRASIPAPQIIKSDIPPTTFKIPRAFKQFRIFFKRDFLSKLTNKQYVLINLLEAPALAGILAFFIKYFIVDHNSQGYIFYENENIPQFLFISVIVALFIGLTVAAEEIVRDKKILAREKFLNLSYSSYIFSKVGIMFILSAIQMVLYAFVGNLILEIKGMTLSYWAVLFTTSCFANVLGLNVSATFNSAKVIYILVPLLIIPQLLFSGIIVSFDKLHPLFSSQKGVPWIGNVMASRWAYEGLAVKQFKDNAYESKFYQFDKIKKYSNWKKDSWIQEVQNNIGQIERNINNESKADDVRYSIQLIQNEIKKEHQLTGNAVSFDRLDEFRFENINSGLMTDLNDYLESLTVHYRKLFNNAEREKENLIYELTKTQETKEEYKNLMRGYKNESLERFVTNRNNLKVIIEHNGELIQKKDLIYTQPYFAGFFDAHFYSPSKRLFGNYIDTFWANIAVIWMMIIFLVITLLFDFFRRVMEFFELVLKKSKLG